MTVDQSTITLIPSLTPTTTLTPSSTLSPTVALTPTPTVTYTPPPTYTREPTKTPIPEILASDVGLIWDPTIVKPDIVKCYILDGNRKIWHAGDAIRFSYSPDKTYDVLTPVDGKIENLSFINENVGWEMNIKTNFLKDGKPVYIDIVHFSEPYSKLYSGIEVTKGMPIAYLKKHYGGGGLNDLFVDIAIRNGPKGANASLESWSPLSYWSFFSMIEDDLNALPTGFISSISTCAGNPIPSEMMYKLTPSP